MSNSQPNINKRFIQSFETVQEEIKDEDIINHFSIIENFDQLKEIVRIIDNNDLTVSLELIQNNNLIDQIKVAEALTKLLNFTENYNNILNNLNLNARVKGNGVSLNKLKANLEGQILTCNYNGYTYKNITITGDFYNKLFKGKTISNDPNANFDFDGSINFKNKIR